MKKIISTFLLCVLLLVPFNVFANENNSDVQCIEYYEDGSYAIIEIVDSEIATRATSVTKSKSYTYYNSKNELEWIVTIKGTFSYDGKTVSCTKAVTSYKIYNDSWKVTDSNASKSGAKAIGDFTIKKYSFGIPFKTVNKTVTLTCSKDGKFS